MIPFNKPYFTGKELTYIHDAVQGGKISGNGKYTQLCQDFFQQRYGFSKCLLTTSCTDALEMAAILIDIQPGDEVMVPSYTFVSSANAFVLRGAKLIFCDSESNHPNMDASTIEALITPKTKAIVPVHYAGNACDMETIMNLANKYNLLVVEDAAQAIDCCYTFSNGEKKYLGGIGHLSAFSFHETKNIISGEGGMLVINDKQFETRAEIIWEKGTNRSQFFRGEVDKYSWVDIGSSFLPSDINAAFLYAQLENIEDIQSHRKALWQHYYTLFSERNTYGLQIPQLASYQESNAHMFYVVTKSVEERSEIIAKLKANNMQAVFHYLSLHKSTFYETKHDGRELPNSDFFSDNLLRLPLFYELSLTDIENIVNTING